MKSIHYYAYGFCLLTLAHISCNPECRSLSNIRLTPPNILPGYEIIILGDPVSALEGRTVYIDNKLATSHFEHDMGLIARVPSDINAGNVDIRLEDPDCLDIISSSLEIVDSDYYEDINNFVPPTPPDIVIPTVPIYFPASLDNAWLNPVNPGYCLWFTMYKEFVYKIDSVTGKPIIDPNTGLPVKIITGSTNLVDPNNSFEQSTCCCERSDPNLPYAQNRMGGIIDSVNNRIEIYIDRTARGGDIEEFVGMFIDKSKTDFEGNTGQLNCPVGQCGTNPCEKNDVIPKAKDNNMMLLTSKKTGRQVVVYQLKSL